MTSAGYSIESILRFIELWIIEQLMFGHQNALGYPAKELLTSV